MKDLFEQEETILKEAKKYITDLEDKEVCGIEEYKKLTREYGTLLKLLRRLTRVTDKTAIELQDQKNTLLNKVSHDALTGIFSRRYFEEELGSILEECLNKESTLSVMMLDVDFFKQYNDTYGHDMGDVCLKSIAKTISLCVEQEDGFAARYGGEEFVVVLADADEVAAAALAQKILEEIRALKIPHEKSQIYDYITISIGGTTRIMDSDIKIDGREFVRNADEALYRSKQRGRNCFTFQEFKEDIE